MPISHHAVTSPPFLSPPMATAPPPSNPLDLDITVVSAKHLKNVNWRHGDLKPYAVFWVHPDHRHATKSDESGSTRPVWNEHFVVPLTLPLHDSVLTLEIFHSKPSESPKPLVATLRLALKDLPDPEDLSRIRTFELRRPSGRPQGKIRIKLAVRERPPPPAPDYHFTPLPSYYYSTAPPPPRDYRGYPPPTFPIPYHRRPLHRCLRSRRHRMRFRTGRTRIHIRLTIPVSTQPSRVLLRRGHSLIGRRLTVGPVRRWITRRTIKSRRVERWEDLGREWPLNRLLGRWGG
ncbi:hypothetical protein NMG60_11011901 [Bertholletia excelsa]